MMTEAGSKNEEIIYIFDKTKIKRNQSKIVILDPPKLLDKIENANCYGLWIDNLSHVL